MGVLVEGAWRDGELPQETGAEGDFRRADSRFRDRITAVLSTRESYPW
jgi:glutathionyl-hydroquinone reductase